MKYLGPHQKASFIKNGIGTIQKRVKAIFQKLFAIVVQDDDADYGKHNLIIRREN